MGTGSLVSNTALNALAKVASAAASLAVNAYAARRLGVNAFGEGQYLIWFVGVLWTYLNIGLPTAVTRYVAVASGRGEWFSADTVRKVLSIMAGILAAGLVCIALFVEENALVLVLTLLLFASLAVQALMVAYCEGRQAFRTVLAATFGGSGAMLALFYPLIRAYGLAGFLASYLVNAVVFIAVVSWRGAGGGMPRTDTDRLQRSEVMQYALYAWVAAAISTFMWQRGELFFIKHYLTAADVAYFSVAMTLVALITQPVLLLGSALFPYFAQTSESDPERAKAMYALLTKVFAWSTFFLCFFAAAHSTVLLSVVYGDAYRDAGALTAIVLAGSGFGVVAGVGSSLVYGTGRTRAVAVMGIAGVAMAFLSGMVIIPAYGVLSAGVTKIANQALMVTAGTFYISRYIGYPFPWRGYLLSLLLAAGCVTLSKLLLQGGSVVLAAAGLALSSALYVAGSKILKVFADDEMVLLRSAKDRVIGALRPQVS